MEIAQALYSWTVLSALRCETSFSATTKTLKRHCIFSLESYLNMRMAQANSFAQKRCLAFILLQFSSFVTFPITGILKRRTLGVKWSAATYTKSAPL